jgi:hypothetical protein
MAEGFSDAETPESILAFLSASLGNSVEAILGFQGSGNVNRPVG